MTPDRREAGLFDQVIDDGRPALLLTAAALAASGAFAIFLSMRREFLPHDVSYLGMAAHEICALADCRIVRFMFHDRVAFGGSLISIAVLYAWIAAVPLRHRETWAWWTFVASGILGFGSFLAYLGYGYLDSWHAAATLALLPVFIIGVVRTSRLRGSARSGWLLSAEGHAARPLTRAGRWGLVGTGAGTLAAGLVILFLGTTDVFVAEDLAFMGLTRESLASVNPRLVPLIAHDRAGFGGGLATTGLVLVLCAWYARPARGFHQALFLAGTAGFGSAIGIHFVEGYTNPVHLAPAFAGALLFAVSAVCEAAGHRSDSRLNRVVTLFGAVIILFGVPAAAAAQTATVRADANINGRPGWVFPTDDHPWIVDWQNLPRADTPAGTARGIEFGTSPFDEGLRNSVERGQLMGVPAYRFIGARQRVSTTFTIFLREIPIGFAGIRVESGKVAVDGK